MAIFRKIHTSFWSDSFISDLDKDKKLFYLYLLTNERTKQCGVYEITKKQISYDLGYSIDTVCKLLEYFIKIGKIKYNETTKELALGNWLKYNSSTSPKVTSCINKEFALVKDTVLIEYVKSMDTQSQEEQKEEQTKEEENNNNKFSFKNSLLEFSNNKQLIDDWLIVRKNKKASNTKTAFDIFMAEVNISDISLDEILTICVEKSWSGYKFKWIENLRAENKSKNNSIIDNAINAHQSAMQLIEDKYGESANKIG